MAARRKIIESQKVLFKYDRICAVAIVVKGNYAYYLIFNQGEKVNAFYA